MTFIQLWKWLRRRLGAVDAPPPVSVDGGRRAAARARFWAELREGQREAEANKIASLLRPPVREEEG
jgi:hypothetical protein